MLFLTVLAVLAVLYSGYGLNQLDVYELSEVPPLKFSEHIQQASDLGKLKSVCILLAKNVEAESLRRRQDYDDLTKLMRRGLKLALGFSVASAIVLLLGWVAAGRTSAKE
jgi:hypothetical protein